MSTASTISSLILWSFLPSLLSSWILWAYYAFRSVFWIHYKKPQAGSYSARIHFHRAFMLLLTAYLFSSLIDAYNNIKTTTSDPKIALGLGYSYDFLEKELIIEPDFGKDDPRNAIDSQFLGMSDEDKKSARLRPLQIPACDSGKAYQTFSMTPSSFSVKQLKSTFRKLSLLHHPDKRKVHISRLNSHGRLILSDSDVDEIFLLIRRRYEMLLDPLKRVALNVFGEGVVSACTPAESAGQSDRTKTYRGTGCRTIREYIWQGALSNLGFYFGLMLVFGAIQVGQWVNGSQKGNPLSNSLIMAMRWILLLFMMTLEWNVVVKSLSYESFSRDSIWFQMANESDKTIEEWIDILHMIFLSLTMYLSHMIPTIIELWSLYSFNSSMKSKSNRPRKSGSGKVSGTQASNDARDFGYAKLTVPQLFDAIQDMQTSMLEDTFITRHLLIEPFLAEPEYLEKLKQKMTNLVGDLQLLSNIEYKKAYERAKNEER